MTRPNEPGLPRRDLLKILAGVPLALGLPADWRVAFGDDGADEPLTRHRDAPGNLPGCAGPEDPTAAARIGEQATAETVRATLARARREERPLLLIGVPAGGHGEPGWESRKRLARNLADLLGEDALTTRVVLAQIVIVVAGDAEIRAALDHADGPAASPDEVASWLADGASDPRRIDATDATLGADATAAAAFVGVLSDRLVGEGEATDHLARRSAGELARLDAATRERVERALAALADPVFGVRETASDIVDELRDCIVATLALRALTDADPEVRARCAETLRPARRPMPIGTEWREFRPSCGRSDPYEANVPMPCGRALPTNEGTPFLWLLAER